MSLSSHAVEPAGARMRAFCKALPKAELHAHLHGSIRPATLTDLVKAAEHLRSSADALHIINDVLPQPGRSLRDCFRIFDLIHSVVTSADVVRRITREMIEDCAADGVHYLEIRTTPRALASSGADNIHFADLADTLGLDRVPDCLPYCAAVLEAIAAAAQEVPSCPVVRVLLSINRTSTIADAASTIELAKAFSVVVLRRSPASLGWQWSRRGDKEFSAATSDSDGIGPLVVGIDISGDPTRGSIEPILTLLRDVRASSALRISIHSGEVMNVKEVEAVLDFGPDRLGHMCVLSPLTINRLMKLLAASTGSAQSHSEASTQASDSSDAALSATTEGEIASSGRVLSRTAFPPPIEVCPTSNALTLHLPTLHHHPTISPWLAAGYPIAICTDDSGVFNVALSDEYYDVASTYGLSQRQVATLALQSLSMGFVPTAALADMQARAVTLVDSLLSSYA